jgi:hypothetical protein
MSGHYRQSTAGMLYLFAISNMAYDAKVEVGSSPSQAQQRWADRPVLYLPLFTSACCEAIIPPLIYFHCNAHRCFAWCLYFPPTLTRSECSALEAMETIELINDIATATGAAVSTFENSASNAKGGIDFGWPRFTAPLPPPPRRGISCPARISY